ncbi:ATP-binding protein [Halorubrum salsamenti]|uniref:ATP-binding protein n=1 Tax=Halorubrum salsamenti TaxID=2583990 RepID=UPI00119DBFF2|nr:ATP-binding protein [Halorubrum salsamenti]
MSDNSTIEVDARPVKEFFIDVITRDVELIDTIPEFVDNSIDGATRSTNSESLEDFFVDVRVSADKVVIKDNCGGIEREIAEEYAFRFGRPVDVQDDLESVIGIFGVGMKRSLFKLGRHFIVESKTDSSHFIIDINVNEWLESDEWNFEMEMISEDDDRSQLSTTGTYIRIDDLLPEVSRKFGQDLFATRLKNELGSKNRDKIRKGLDITVNRESATYAAIEIYQSDELIPAYKEYSFEQGDDEVQVELKAGLGERSPDDAGWYIFCNGRLVLRADRQETTGWGSDTVPQYHNNFSRFRGTVNFKSESPGALPWNTTKTDVNPDAPVFRNARQEMEQMMNPIITTLREIAVEKSERGESTVEQKIANSSIIKISEIESSGEQSFSSPNPEEEEDDEPNEVHIQYTREEAEVDEVKEILGVDTNQAVGIKTFEYFYKYEVGE